MLNYGFELNDDYNHNSSGFIAAFIDSVVGGGGFILYASIY